MMKAIKVIGYILLGCLVLTIGSMYGAGEIFTKWKQ